MIKKSLYPKTKRISSKQKKIEVTEKLDGSNLGIFKLNEQLWIAQRNYVFCWNKIEEFGSQGLYKGLYSWLKDNGEGILNNLYEGSGVFGEWIGMGKIGYGNSDIDSKFYMFAKARLNEELEVSNIIYDRELIPFAFSERNVPSSIKLVPVAYELETYPTKMDLDRLYEEYCERVGRKVEGFIVNSNNNIVKYVRFKNGKMSEHMESGE